MVFSGAKQRKNIYNDNVKIIIIEILYLLERGMTTV
jgi:hypothetical protein